MEDKVAVYGNVPFADVQVGSIVVLGDYYDRTAVGVVDEKRETATMKSIIVRFGFDTSESCNVVLEEKVPTSGQPMYTLLSVIRSYV